MLNIEMHEVVVETNIFSLSLVFHDLTVGELEALEPRG
jgi:hypothetical protein